MCAIDMQDANEQAYQEWEAEVETQVIGLDFNHSLFIVVKQRKKRVHEMHAPFY